MMYYRYDIDGREQHVYMWKDVLPVVTPVQPVYMTKRDLAE